MKQANTFSKTERLCSKKAIDLLFSSGDKWVSYPFRLIIRKSEDTDGTFSKEEPVQILISAAKRNFKKAVDRNLIKRRIREAFRQQKHALYSLISNRLSETKNFQLHIGFLYTAKTIEPWSLIEKKMARALDEIIEKLLNNDFDINEK